MSLLVVGQAPGRELPAGVPAFWDSDSIRRLAEYAGIGADNWERMYELADFVNLVQDYPGRWADGTGHVKDKFPHDEARLGLRRVWVHALTHWPCRVIFLGHRTARIAGCADWPLFDWQMAVPHEVFVARAPHPSGRNRWWNDADNLATGQDFWRATLA